MPLRLPARLPSVPAPLPLVPSVTSLLRRAAALPLAALLGGLPVLLLLLLLGPQTALAGGTVTNCTEAGLNAALTGGGAVVFNCGPSPVTITVTSQKIIAQPTSIDGGGLVTLSGGGATRIFSVTAAGSLSLSNLTLYHGHAISQAGGAIYNNGTVSLVNLTLLSNTASGSLGNSLIGAGGGVFNASAGRLNVRDSAILSNESDGGAGGAGIYSSGAVTITGSRFHGNVAMNDGDGGGLQTNGGTALIQHSQFVSNTAGYGGAIDNDNALSLTLINSQLTDNLGIEDGGAMDIDSGAIQTFISDTFAYNRSPFGNGGAIWNNSQLTVRDSLFYGNVAGVGDISNTENGGAIYHSSGALTLTNSTLYNNRADLGGGLYIGAPLTATNNTLVSNTAVITDSGGNLYLDSAVAKLKNNIVAGGSPVNCAFNAGTLTSLGHNLESANTCGLTAGGDLTNTNPLLGALGNFGGPTLSLALPLGSPAINQGDNNGCPATDQRGGARPFNAICDIGAIEFGAITQLWLPLIRR